MEKKAPRRSRSRWLGGAAVPDEAQVRSLRGWLVVAGVKARMKRAAQVPGETTRARVSYGRQAREPVTWGVQQHCATDGDLSKTEGHVSDTQEEFQVVGPLSTGLKFILCV